MHPAAKKQGGFRAAANGIVGLETAAAITWQTMVVEEGMPPADWIARWTSGPAALIGETPAPAEDSFAILDLRANRQVEPASFRTRSRNQPFAGMRFAAWPVMTVFKGKVTHNELLDV